MSENLNKIQTTVKEVLDKFRKDFRGQKYIPKYLFPIRELKVLYLKIRGIQNYLESLPIGEFPDRMRFRQILTNLRREEQKARSMIFYDQLQCIRYIGQAVEVIRDFLETLKKYEVYKRI